MRACVRACVHARTHVYVPASARVRECQASGHIGTSNTSASSRFVDHQLNNGDWNTIVSDGKVRLAVHTCAERLQWKLLKATYHLD
mmetsp:Transcript_62460/g.103909  ORF Transcript_62460/g.103909 Transcript_62460/m.103909 type:complete len:86 (-) Transcript_62460:603-860(-)